MKRLFDIISCGLLVILFAVPMALTALAVKLTSRGPILYWSDRVGWGKCMFRYTPLEAQACGVPVVTTTATGAVGSVVDGVTGFHVAVGNWEALAARIDQLLCDPELRSHMGQRGREQVVLEFRHELVGQALLEGYDRLLRGKVGFHIQALRRRPDSRS